MKILDKALYVVFLGPFVPESCPDYIKARILLEKFDVRKLGEETAILALCEIICHVNFPDEHVRKELVGWAERKLTEFFNVDPDYEFGMDEAFYIKREILGGKKIEQLFPYQK